MTNWSRRAFVRAFGLGGAAAAAVPRFVAARGREAFGCGSTEILRMVMQAFTSRTSHLVTAAPTFETPSKYADAFGVPIRAVRVGANLTLNLATMELEAQGAGLVYVCNPNNPTATVLSAPARATLGDKLHVERERTINRETREFTQRMFTSMGCTVAPSETNFILVDLRRDSRPFRDGCRRAGVVVGRPFPPLSNHVRISIGTMDEMQRAGATMKRVLSAL